MLPFNSIVDHPVRERIGVVHHGIDPFNSIVDHPRRLCLVSQAPPSLLSIL